MTDTKRIRIIAGAISLLSFIACGAVVALLFAVTLQSNLRAECGRLDGVFITYQAYSSYYAVVCKLPDATDVVIRVNK